MALPNTLISHLSSLTFGASYGGATLSRKPKIRPITHRGGSGPGLPSCID